MVSAVNGFTYAAIALSLATARVSRLRSKKNTERPDHAPKWVAIAAALLVCWALFLAGVPRLSPTRTLKSRLVAVYTVAHTHRGSTYYSYSVIFLAQEGDKGDQEFDGPKSSLYWPHTFDLTYSYRTWDRDLISVVAPEEQFAWHEADPSYDTGATLCLLAGVALAGVSYFMNKCRQKTSEAAV